MRTVIRRIDTPRNIAIYTLNTGPVGAVENRHVIAGSVRPSRRMRLAKRLFVAKGWQWKMTNDAPTHELRNTGDLAKCTLVEL